MSDPETVEIAEMVLCGSINKGIASSIKQAGGRAVGLSGKDDNLLLAKKLGKKAVDEATGEVKVCDNAVNCLSSPSFWPENDPALVLEL